MDSPARVRIRLVGIFGYGEKRKPGERNPAGDARALPLTFAKEPNVDGRQKKVLSAPATFGW